MYDLSKQLLKRTRKKENRKQIPIVKQTWLSKTENLFKRQFLTPLLKKLERNRT